MRAGLQIFFLLLCVIPFCVCSQPTQKQEVLSLVVASDSALYDNPQYGLELASKAHELATSLQNDSLISLTLNRMGSAHWSLGNGMSALEKIQASLQLAEANKLQAIVAKNLGNIGDIYAASGLDLDAIGYYKSELEIQRDLGDDFRLFIVHNNLAKAFLEINEYDSAENYLSRIARNSKSDFERYHSIFFSNLAEFNFRTGSLDKADSLIGLTMANAEIFGSKRGLIIANQLRAKIRLEMGKNEQALLHAKVAFSMAKASNVKELIYLTSKTLSECYGALGLFEEAYRKEQLYEQYLDSVQSVSTVNELELLSYYQRLFQMRVLEAQNSSNKQLAEQRQLIIHGLVVALIIAAILIAIIVLVVRELGIQKRKLENLNAFKAKIFAIISHDLKSPIQSVSSVIEMFNEKIITKEEIEPYLPEVKEKTSNLMSLLNNMFLWAEGQMEGENIQSRDFNVASLVIDLEKELEQRLSEKGVKLRYKIPQDFSIHSDPGIIRILLRNLIVNAIKYSHPDSSVEINFSKSEKATMMEVVDHGVGMKEDIRQNLFRGELDSTPGTVGELGNGLGLALCYDFVKTLGGKIEVESKEGQGSLFRIILQH